VLARWSALHILAIWNADATGAGQGYDPVSSGQVRLNQPHPANVTPSWYGDSVGHYEGDTLVIDTVGIKIGPFSMVDMYGRPGILNIYLGRGISADGTGFRKNTGSLDVRDLDIHGKL